MTTKTAAELGAQNSGVLAFRVSAELLERADLAAAVEGISRSDVARRALLRDLARQGATA
jgi:hypothetical protein